MLKWRDHHSDMLVRAKYRNRQKETTQSPLLIIQLPHREERAPMENKFIPQAIEIVTSAIHEDNAKNYEEAFRLYKKALEHFMIGVKCKCSSSSLPCKESGKRLHVTV